MTAREREYPSDPSGCFRGNRQVGPGSSSRAGCRTAEHQLSPSDTSFGGGVAAVFLDRDGVINENAYVNSPDDLILIPGSAQAISRLNRAGIPVVIVTNQGGIAMGHLSEESLARIHVHLRKLLAEQGAKADAIYYCPHMPNARIVVYRLDCPCRKPGSGMLEKASEQLGIDLAKSVLVGDSTTDILAGARAGCRTILVKTGFGGNDGKAVAVPGTVVADLSAAVDLIMESAGTI